VYFFEESVKSGGIGEHLAGKLLCGGFKGKFNLNAVENEFVPVAESSVALAKCGLDSKAMVKKIKGA